VQEVQLISPRAAIAAETTRAPRRASRSTRSCADKPARAATRSGSSSRGLHLRGTARAGLLAVGGEFAAHEQ
jgi:hypothetical protein